MHFLFFRSSRDTPSAASPGQPVSGKRQRANDAALPPAGVKRQKPLGRDHQRQRAAATDGDQDSSADEAMPQSQESKGTRLLATACCL
mgnify:CR=1 FL=1